MKTVKLGDICLKITDGSHNPPKATADGGFMMLSSRNIQDDEISFDNIRLLSKEDFDQENKRTDIQPGDVLLTIVGTIGRTIVVPEDLPKFTLQRSVAVIKPNKEFLDPSYLMFHLRSDIKFLTDNARGVAQKGIYLNQIKDLKIDLPSLEEQRRIVARLDAAFEKVDRAIELTRKNSNNVKEFYDTSLASAFDNNIEIQSQSLENIGIITSSKRIYKSEYEKSGVPFYRTKEVKELANSKSVSTELYISKERYHLIRDQFGVPSPGDLLVTAIGTIGEIYVVRDKKEFYFKDGNVLWLKDFKSIDSFFLKYALQRFVTELNSLSYGSAYNALPIQKLKKYVVPVPPIEKQLEVVKKLDTVSLQTQKLQQLYRIKLQSLESLKQSLLTQAFSQDKVQ